MRSKYTISNKPPVNDCLSFARHCARPKGLKGEYSNYKMNLQIGFNILELVQMLIDFIDVLAF